MNPNSKYKLTDAFIGLIKVKFTELNNQSKLISDSAIIRKLHIYVHILFDVNTDDELDKINDLEMNLINKIRTKFHQLNLFLDDFDKNMNRTPEKYIKLGNRTQMPEHYLKIFMLIIFPDWNCSNEGLESYNTKDCYWKINYINEQIPKIDILKTQLLQLSSDSVNCFINSNRTKYNKNEFVRRDFFEKSFKQFAQNNESKLFIVQSNSGLGKTNIICNLALDLIKNEQLIFSFEPQTIDRQLKDLFSDQLIQDINNYAEATNSNAFFIFDAINETNKYDQIELNHLTPDLRLLNDISNKLLSKNYLNIKVVITCRSEHYFLHEKQIDNIFRSLSEKQKTYFTLGHYGKQELFILYPIYEKKFKLQTTYEEFSSPKYNQVHRTIKNPLHFFFIAKVYQGKKIPCKEHELDFVSVVRLMIRELNTEEISTRALFEFVEVCFKQGRDYIFQDELVQSKPNDEIYNLSSLFLNIEIKGGVLSNAAQKLIDANFIRYNTGLIQFEYERVKESLFEIAFLNKNVNKTDGNRLPEKAFTDILDKSVSSKIELNNQIVLSNALYNHCINNNEYSALEALSMNTNRKSQKIVYIVLQRFLDFNPAKCLEIIHQMKKSKDKIVLSTVLNLVIDYLKGIDQKKYAQIKKQGEKNNPVELIRYMLENAPFENFSHEILERLFYNLMQQNMPLFEIVFNDLFQILWKEGEAINLNYLTQIGLLSCCLIIDALINQKNNLDVDLIITCLKKLFKKIFNSRYKIIYPSTTNLNVKLFEIISFLPLKMRNYFMTQYLRKCIYKLCTMIHGKYVNNLLEYEPFWKIPLKLDSPQWSRTEFKELIRFLDYKTPHFLQKKEIITSGYLSIDPFSFIVLERVLIIQGIYQLQNVLPIITQVLSSTKSNHYRHYIQMSICYSLSHILRNIPVNQWGVSEEEAFTILETTVKSWTKSCYGQFYTPRSEKLKQPKKYTQYMINFYVQASYQKLEGKLSCIDQLPICKELIDDAFDKNDKSLLLHCIENIPQITNNSEKIDPALILYRYIISKKLSEENFSKLNNTVMPDYIENRSIIELLASVFNTLNSSHPHDMQDFELLVMEPLVQEKNIICTHLMNKKAIITDVENTVPSLLTNLFGNFFVWGLKQPKVLEFIIDNLTYATKGDDAVDWFNHGVEEASRILFDHRLK